MSFRVKKYLINTKKFASAKKISLVFLSDLHLNEHGADNCELLRAIRNSNPDFVLSGGDMVTGKETCQDAVAINVLLDLAKTYPVYCSLGNHEQRLKMKTERFGNRYKQYLAELSDGGVHMLDNTYEELLVCGEKIRIYGLNLPLMHYRRFTRHELSMEELTECIGDLDRTYFNLLMAHHPRYAQSYFSWGADLTLSGHIHGGIMRLGKKACISPDFQIFPKYGYGRHMYQNQTMLISGGLGEHTIPFRMFNPKELLYIEIKQEVSHGDSR